MKQQSFKWRGGIDLAQLALSQAIARQMGRSALMILMDKTISKRVTR
jgi:hypothetical protein